MTRTALTLGTALLIAAPRSSIAQERGAAALGELVSGLGVSARVLVIGAHPDDESTPLITFLARGRHVETAYLSLTRGDGGQNLIGNELGEALGVIRTEELLAARRIDGAHQYFTRAYDFGFSKSAEEAYTHWPHDSLLKDVVTVVRAFRPHVIAAVFSGTPADGHGQHQVSGLLAREAFDAAADTVRFPRAATAGYGPWTPMKFYRAAWFARDKATLTFNVGEYSPLLGRSYYELAMESRSQHRSQGMGRIQAKGAQLDVLLREVSRVAAPADPKQEKSLFDGIDTTFARLKPLVKDRAQRAALDSLPAAIAAVQRAYSPFDPSALIKPLAMVQRLVLAASGNGDQPCVATKRDALQQCADLEGSTQVALRRIDRAAALAAGVAAEATVER